MVGDDQATLMVDRNSAIGLFTLARSKLTLRGWRRSIKRHIADVKNIADGSLAMTMIDWSSAITKMYAYEVKQNLSKNIFLLLGSSHYFGIAHCFFPTITGKGFCSHLRKIISLRPWPPPQDRDIHIIEFFVDSIYSKPIDIIRKQYWFSIFKQMCAMCKARHPDNGAILQVAF